MRGETTVAAGMRLNERSPNVSTKDPNDKRVAIAFSTEGNSGIGNDLADASLAERATFLRRRQ